ncbi:bromodomain-containing protein 8 isoform X2 [Hyposmocoma kahamanoa]|uniref:bromodomain-containing protein 8 isoform X2 n=1 Tax=Hyposmocoma kahamanoa TaxID=1477025 RepID=UPI000E6D8606|nr:bromodomain-containing protein 8 isoform X2 [Hyposmocoma kahamanoa]
MSSIQERLQLKRVPLDTWNIREQLCLASAVVRSGDQNWMSVSRALKTVGEPNRPPDWYSQKSCAAQYGALLEHVETPKRKKRSSEGAVETPQESILKRLTQERIVEIQKTIAEMNQQYEQLKNEINETRNSSTSEERLREIWAEVETAKRVRERETARRAQWLKDREERRARAERTWRPPAQSTTIAPSPPTTPSSPLLTSLLKSSPVVTTPQHISHPANVVETVSPSAGAPTLSMLLEKGGSGSGGTCASGSGGVSGSVSPHDNKHAAIEHIKSQLVQIEQQLKASTNTTPPVPLPTVTAVAPAVDIDDIEIKAEDVYAFRDIDIHIPPVGHLHKANVRPEKPPFKNDESEMQAPVLETVTEQSAVNEEEVKDAATVVDTEVTDEILPVDIEAVQAIETPTDEQHVPEVDSTAFKIGFPEVKFPTTEIKVIQPDEQKIKDEVKETEVQSAVAEKEDNTDVRVEDEPVIEQESTIEQTTPDVETPVQEQIQEEPIVEEATLLPPEPQIVEPPSEAAAPDASLPQEEVPEQAKDEEITEHVEPKEENVDKSDDAKVEDPEDSIPLRDMVSLREEPSAPVDVKEEPPNEQETEETHTETDDDTPMELSREEEKDGKKKRDYSRKKKPDSRPCSGSESAAEASAPESPSANDAERQHRLWKKSVMLVYSRLCAHKYASIFLRPITDEEAPGYSMVIKRPMDLTTIRRNIEAGVIRTTAEFQRDVLLLLSNALMYNSSEHSVYTMAKEMFEEAVCQLGMLLAAQAHAGLMVPLGPQRRKRRRDTSPLNPAHAKRH